MERHRIGIIGLGKVAIEQHLPAIQENAAFELIAVSSANGDTWRGDAQAFADYRDMLLMPELDVVAICTPPSARHEIARAALIAGKDTLLEKPPTATLAELAALEREADRSKKVLFLSWHSQHNDAVEIARRTLAGETLQGLRVTWKEDVGFWHPGQKWIWEQGGFGVLDMGINAFSILTRILPAPLFVRQAELQYLSDAQTPIAASIAFGSHQPSGDLRAEFDWRSANRQIWEIELRTEQGATVTLREGGRRLEIDGRVIVDGPSREYTGVYTHFASLLRERRSEVDWEPFRLVADVFMVGRRTVLPATTVRV
jgi:D-galactose 1-dehydrogenase